MRTPSPDSEIYRHEVQSRIQNILSGPRSRHPVSSQHSTRQLILEGILKEVRIYRLKKEQEVLKVKEEAARMNGRDRKEKSSGVRLGHVEVQEESSRRGQMRDGRRGEGKEHILARGGRDHSQEQQDEDPGFMMKGGASGVPPLGQATAMPKHGSVVIPKAKDAHTCLNSQSPGEGIPHNKQKLDRNGRPLFRGKRGWRDASPGPFPEYKFKIGPMFGIGNHLKERFHWGVENHHLEQRRKARRERGRLDERRKVKREKANDDNEKAEGTKKKPMSKSDGKKPVKDNHASYSRRGALSREALDPSLSPYDNVQHEQNVRAKIIRHEGRRANIGHVDKATKGEHSRQYGEDTRRRRSESRGGLDTGREAHAEADARSKAERRARHEAKSNPSTSGYRGSYNSSDNRNGKHGKSHPSTARLDSQIPVYENTPYSQSIEARERAEAEAGKAKGK
jgi:hypothetical protein